MARETPRKAPEFVPEPKRILPCHSPEQDLARERAVPAEAMFAAVIEPMCAQRSLRRLRSAQKSDPTALATDNPAPVASGAGAAACLQPRANPLTGALNQRTTGEGRALARLEAVAEAPNYRADACRKGPDQHLPQAIPTRLMRPAAPAPRLIPRPSRANPHPRSWVCALARACWAGAPPRLLSRAVLAAVSEA